MGTNNPELFENAAFYTIASSVHMPDRSEITGPHCFHDQDGVLYRSQ
jgi:hypothetical protein